MKRKDTILKVLRYIRKYQFQVILSLILAALTVALTLYVPILTGEAVDLIVDKGLVDMPGIFRIMKSIAVIMIITAVGQWVMNTCNNYITYHVVKDIREDAFHKLERLPLKYLDSKAYGDIVSRIIADVDTFADGLLMGFTQLFSGVITILGTLGLMLVANVPITLVVVCITPISFLVAKFIASRTYSMFKLQSQTRGEQTSLIEEMIGNQKIVKIFSREKAVSDQFAEINGRLEKCFLSYANQYTKPFNEISGVVTELQNALVCASRIFELIEVQAQIPDKEEALVLHDAEGNVNLEKVYFKYVPEKKLIQNFNLTVKPGQRVAIVGPTGWAIRMPVRTR